MLKNPVKMSNTHHSNFSFWSKYDKTNANQSQLTKLNSIKSNLQQKPQVQSKLISQHQQRCSPHETHFSILNPMRTLKFLLNELQTNLPSDQLNVKLIMVEINRTVQRLDEHLSHCSVGDGLHKSNFFSFLVSTGVQCDTTTPHRCCNEKFTQTNKPLSLPLQSIETQTTIQLETQINGLGQAKCQRQTDDTNEPICSDTKNSWTAAMVELRHEIEELKQKKPPFDKTHHPRKNPVEIQDINKIRLQEKQRKGNENQLLNTAKSNHGTQIPKLPSPPPPPPSPAIKLIATDFENDKDSARQESRDLQINRIQSRFIDIQHLAQEQLNMINRMCSTSPALLSPPLPAQRQPHQQHLPPPHPEKEKCRRQRKQSRKSIFTQQMALSSSNEVLGVQLKGINGECSDQQRSVCHRQRPTHQQEYNESLHNATVTSCWYSLDDLEMTEIDLSERGSHGRHSKRTSTSQNRSTES